MVLIEDVVVTIVLIENALTLLMMIEHQPEHKPTTAMAMAIPKQQSNTVLGVAVEYGPAIATIVATIDVSANNMISSMSDTGDNK